MPKKQQPTMEGPKAGDGLEDEARALVAAKNGKPYAKAFSSAKEAAKHYNEERQKGKVLVQVNVEGKADIQSLRGELQDALLAVHRKTRRKKSAKEAVDAAETDLMRARRNTSIDGRDPSDAAEDLVLAMEAHEDCKNALKEAKRDLKAAEKNLEAAGWRA